MRSRFTITDSAERDLHDIIGYIAQDNPNAAVKVRNEIYAAFEHLADMPGTGHFREDILDKRHRFWSIYSYLIVYRWKVQPIQIIAVVHGARNLRALFNRE
jgi:antitoxin ParD1/3/4/toxin ParE1/3/4